MLKTWKKAACAAVVLAVTPAALLAQMDREQERAVEQAVRAVSVEMRQAATRLDVAALYEYVIDGPTPPIIENGNIQPTRASALANTQAGFQGITAISYSYTREHVTVLSPQTALWVGEGNSRLTLTDGREFTAPFAETLVFVLQAGKWKLLHGHRSTPPR
jgi:hypothetical protein